MVGHLPSNLYISLTEILFRESTSHYSSWTCWVFLSSSWTSEYLECNPILANRIEQKSGLWGSFSFLVRREYMGRIHFSDGGKWYAKTNQKLPPHHVAIQIYVTASIVEQKTVMQSHWTHQQKLHIWFGLKERSMILVAHCGRGCCSSSWNTLPEESPPCSRQLSHSGGMGWTSLIHFAPHNLFYISGFQFYCIWMALGVRLILIPGHIPEQLNQLSFSISGVGPGMDIFRGAP